MKYLLIGHVTAGFLGLMVGVLAMSVKKYSERHHAFGQIYFWLMCIVCLTGAILPIFNWEKNWWLLVVSIFSFAFALRGWLAERHRKEGWITVHIKGMLGSYIALVTAFVVVNVHHFEELRAIPRVVFWILPTVVGTPLIRRVAERWKRVK